jgi:hypothetical protein
VQAGAGFVVAPGKIGDRHGPDLIERVFDWSTGTYPLTVVPGFRPARG